MIRGERVYLTALDRENAESTRVWFNDRGVARWFIDELVPNTPAKMLEFYDEAETSEKMHVLEIHVAKDERYIGVVGFVGVDLRRHRTAEFGIGIGPEDGRDRGYGTDATITCLRWGFETLGLHTVWLGAVDDNDRGLAVYRKVGFRDVGRLRERVFVDGTFRDLALMDITAAEFFARHGDPA